MIHLTSQGKFKDCVTETSQPSFLKLLKKNSGFSKKFEDLNIFSILFFLEIETFGEGKD